MVEKLQRSPMLAMYLAEGNADGDRVGQQRSFNAILARFNDAANFFQWNSSFANLIFVSPKRHTDHHAGPP